MKRKIIAAALAGMLILSGCSAEYSVNGTAGGSAGDSSKSSDMAAKDADPMADQAFDRVIYDAMTVPYMSLRAYGQHAEDALIAGEVEIRRLDDLLSTGKSGSDTAKINANGGGVLTPDTAYLTEVSLDLHDSTGGAFDISVYPLMELWGFTSQFEDEAGNTGTVRREAPAEKDIADILTRVDASKIEYDADKGSVVLPDQMRIDFGVLRAGFCFRGRSGTAHPAGGSRVIFPALTRQRGKVRVFLDHLQRQHGALIGVRYDYRGIDFDGAPFRPDRFMPAVRILGRDFIIHFPHGHIPGFRQASLWEKQCHKRNKRNHSFHFQPPIYRKGGHRLSRALPVCFVYLI